MLCCPVKSRGQICVIIFEQYHTKTSTVPTHDLLQKYIIGRHFGRQGDANIVLRKLSQIRYFTVLNQSQRNKGAEGAKVAGGQGGGGQSLDKHKWHFCLMYFNFFCVKTFLFKQKYGNYKSSMEPK